MYRLPWFIKLPNRAKVLHTEESDKPNQINVYGP